MQFPKIGMISVVIALLFCLVFPSSVFAATSGTQNVTETSSRILVKFQPNVISSEVAEIHRQNGGKVEQDIPEISVQVVNVPVGQALAKAKAYAANPKVVFAEPDFIAQAAGDPNDPYFIKQWGMVKVGASEAWQLTSGSETVKIAILDTGIDLEHPDLASKIVASVNYTGSLTSDDIYGHGTHVAGIAAAITDNGIGVAGLGYNAKLMNVKVMGDTGSGSYSWITQGVIWAADNGASVINMSLGGTSASSTLKAAIDYAWSKGVVVVAAAGNNGSSVPFYPAYYDNVIAVAATDSSDILSSWSDYGDWVDLAAPGSSIYSTLINNGYGYKSGTSMASPFVAGLAALVFTRVMDDNCNGLLNDEVRQQIQATCDDIGVNGIGSGRINAVRAVQTGDIVPITGNLTGTVNDATTGLPLAGAIVAGETFSAITGAGGFYDIANLSEGTYTLTISLVDYLSSTRTVSVVSGETTTVNIALAPDIPEPVPGKITGIVTDATTGLPLAAVTVSGETFSATTGADGSYAVENLAAGIYNLTVTAAGYIGSMQTVSVTEGQSVIVNFILAPVVISPPAPEKYVRVESLQFNLTGKILRLTSVVTGDKGPVAGAKVDVRITSSSGIVWNFTGTTDAYGMVIFTISKPVAGDYLAVITGVSAAGYLYDGSKGTTSVTYTVGGSNIKPKSTRTTN